MLAELTRSFFACSYLAKSRRSCKLLSTKLFCRWPAAARDLDSVYVPSSRHSSSRLGSALDLRNFVNLINYCLLYLLSLACGGAVLHYSCWPAAARDLVDFRLRRDFCVFYQFTKSHNRCIPDNYTHSNLNSFHSEGLPRETQIAKATVFLLCCKSTIFFIIDQIFFLPHLYI